MLSVFAFDGAGPRLVDDPDQISDLLQDKDTVVWADVLHPDADDLQWISQEFSLHPLAIEDAATKGERPKLELFDGHAILVAYAATNKFSELSEVDIFIGPNWLITVHEKTESGAHFDIDAVRERCHRTVPEKTKVAFLLYTVLDEIVDSYFGAVELIGDEIDDIEEKIFGDVNPEADERPIQREMLNIRKKLLSFRRRVVPLREVFLMLLRDDLSYIDADSHHYFQDVLDHIMRITDEIDNRRELIGNAVDAHLAMVSNQMNQTMKKMTSWGAILIVSTLISGVFGMNFDDTPLLHYQNGFLVSLVVMGTLTLGMYLWFKAKHWL